MAELKLPRLLAAAKEFNVGQDTLIDFLEGKGFDKDDLKPTSKLSEDMYRALQQEFQGDKVAKLKSDQIDLPKGSVEAKKKKEEETVIFKKETAPKKVVEEVKPEPVVVAKVEEPKKVVVEEAPPPVAVPEVKKVEAPELEGPKVIDKIDLSAIDSSTRPKKGAKAKEEPKVKEEPKAAEPVAEKPKAKGKKAKAAEKEPELEKELPVASAEEAKEEPPVIENIKADKLEGPKILGKIELPSEAELRAKAQPHAPGNADEKRKRKRIPIEKKEQFSP